MWLWLLSISIRKCRRWKHPQGIISKFNTLYMQQRSRETSEIKSANYDPKNRRHDFFQCLPWRGIYRHFTMTFCRRMQSPIIPCRKIKIIRLAYHRKFLKKSFLCTESISPFESANYVPNHITMAPRRRVPKINPIIFLAEKSNKCDQRIIEPLKKKFVCEMKALYPLKSENRTQQDWRCGYYMN